MPDKEYSVVVHLGPPYKRGEDQIPIEVGKNVIPGMEPECTVDLTVDPTVYVFFGSRRLYPVGALPQSVHGTFPKVHVGSTGKIYDVNFTITATRIDQ